MIKKMLESLQYKRDRKIVTQKLEYKIGKNNITEELIMIEMIIINQNYLKYIIGTELDNEEFFTKLISKNKRMKNINKYASKYKYYIVDKFPEYFDVIDEEYVDEELCMIMLRNDISRITYLDREYITENIRKYVIENAEHFGYLEPVINYNDLEDFLDRGLELDPYNTLKLLLKSNKETVLKFIDEELFCVDLVDNLIDDVDDIMEIYKYALNKSIFAIRYIPDKYLNRLIQLKE